MSRASIFSLNRFGIVQLCLFVIFLESMYAWFFIGLNPIIYPLSAIVLSHYLINRKYAFHKFKEFIIPIFFLFLLRLYITDYSSISSILGNILRIYIFTIVLLLHDRYKSKIFIYLTKAFAILLSISILFWFLKLLGLYESYSYLSIGENTNSHLNHFFFLTQNRFDFIPRFMSVFLEPGHLGMIASFLLFGNSFKLKNKYVLIIFISTLLTFSLAAYLLCFISYMSLLFLKNNRILSFFFITLIFFLFYIISINYNNGSNIINNLVIDRLMFDGEQISGWNRFTDNFNDYYDNFITSPESLFGIGQNELVNLFPNRVSIGYKTYIIAYGLVGLLILFAFYFSLALKYRKKITFILLLIYSLSFLQRPYAVWDVQILIFICALPYINNLNKIDKSL